MKTATSTSTLPVSYFWIFHILFYFDFLVFWFSDFSDLKEGRQFFQFFFLYFFCFLIYLFLFLVSPKSSTAMHFFYFVFNCFFCTLKLKSMKLSATHSAETLVESRKSPPF